MAMNEDQLEKDETSTLSADKVEGTSVMNPAGKKLGTIEDVMIDKRSGKVAYAGMSFGGFLGFGDRHHPLPWGALKYDTNLSGYVVNLDRKTLEKARPTATMRRSTSPTSSTGADSTITTRCRPTGCSRNAVIRIR